MKYIFCFSIPDEEDRNLEIKIFFNKTCHPGLLLNPDKISQIAPHTPQEKPPQALKYLIERLIEVSINKEKFLEVLEVAFGNRLFNKTKDKVIKKVLYVLGKLKCIFNDNLPRKCKPRDNQNTTTLKLF